MKKSYLHQDNKRIHKLQMKLNYEEREQLNKVVASEGKNISDVVRHALKETYSLDGFEPSYNETSKFNFENKRSIF